MKNILVTFGILFTLNVCGQGKNPDETVSFQDSILLHNFWIDFTNAIEKNDKYELAALCKFPFYCRPCIDDTTLKHNNHVTIKVTKKLFYESQFKEFFDKPMKDEVAKHKNFDTNMFYRANDDKNRRNGFMFSYVIIAPSKQWEGLQGFVYISKKGDKFKITGIDTVP